jgi:hypothetical protein
MPSDPWALDPCAPYDVEPADLSGLPFGMSVRVSDDRQTSNGSTDLQGRRIRSFARKYGLVDSGLIWARTQSGKKMASAVETREQLEAARTGQIKVLVFYDSSRYARDLLGALQIEEELDRLGCFVVYLEDGAELIASNAATRAAKNRKHADNQEYIDKLGRRVGDGIEGFVVRGDDDVVEVVSQAGIAPFGWRRPDRFNLPLAHHSVEAPIVRAVAGRFLQPGETCATVAAWANEAGYETRRGNSWTKQAIYDLLTLPLHRGVLGYHVSRKAKQRGYLDGVTGSIDPLFAPELAARIDAKLAEGLRGRSRAVLASHHRRFIYILAGLAWWRCGRKATAQYGGSQPHPRYHHPGTHPHCEPDRQSYAEVEYLGRLADFWRAFRLTDEICADVLAHLEAEAAGAGDLDQRHLEIARLEAELRARAAEFAGDSTLTALDLERLRRDTRDRIAALRAEPAPAEQRQVDLEAAAELLRSVGDLWGDPKDDAPELQAARRDLMTAVFDRVELWGPFVTGLRPRAAFAALVAAGAYQAAEPAPARIEILLATTRVAD